MNSGNTIAAGGYTGTFCVSDHIEITGLKKVCGDSSGSGSDRVCGQTFNIEDGNIVDASSLCGKSKSIYF